VDTDVVAAALTALLDLQENWITNDLYVHRYSIGILDVVRRNVLAGNWLTVYDSLYVLFNIPEGVEEGSQPMEAVPEGVVAVGSHVVSRRLHSNIMNELVFAYEYAKYHLSMHCLQCALGQGKMRGDVGSVDTSAINIHTLFVALLIVKNVIKADHPDSLAVVSEAEFILDLRKAEFQGIWFRDPPEIHTHSMSSTDIITQPTIEEYLTATLLQTRLSPSTTYSEGVEKGVDLAIPSVSLGSTGTILDASNRIQYVRDFFHYVMQQDNDVAFISDAVKVTATISVEELLTRGCGGITNDEILFAQKEFSYRFSCLKLLEAVGSRGIEGTPGDLVCAHAQEEILVEAIETAKNVLTYSLTYSLT
jgi:hypothetical protein